MIKVLKAGLYSSVQDLGRSPLQPIGVPMGGAMDRESALNANALLENAPEAAVLEITMTGPVLAFTENAWVAFSGAIFPIFFSTYVVRCFLWHPVAPRGLPLAPVWPRDFFKHTNV